jgi:hypothetical protein
MHPNPVVQGKTCTVEKYKNLYKFICITIKNDLVESVRAFRYFVAYASQRWASPFCFIANR